MVYNSLGIYIAQAKGNLIEENEKLQEVLDALKIAMLDSIGNSGTQEFMLNDGQTIIKGINRNPLDLKRMYSAIKDLMLENEQRINGRVFKNVNARNFMDNRFYNNNW